MIAKIIKGINFCGVVNYMLSKHEGKAKVLQAIGVRSSLPNDIAHDFNLQASMCPSVQKPVLSYVSTALVTMVRPSATATKKYRSTKICRELTERYGLTIGEGKQEVNRSRLRGEDKLRYEIFDTIKAVLPQSQTWKDFVAELEQQGITTRFKTKDNTDVVQGIIFEKDGCSFRGSKIARSCSFSRLNAEIERNSHKQEQIHLQNEPMAHSVDESYFITDLSEAISEVFSMPAPSNGIDVDELRFQKETPQ